MVKAGAPIDTVGVIEACYRDETDDTSWFAGVLEAAASLLSYGLGYFATVIQEHETAQEIVLSACSDGHHEFMEANVGVFRSITPAMYRRALYPKTPIVFASTHVRACFGNEMHALFQRMQSDIGAGESLGAYGHPLPGLAFFIGSAMQKRDDLTPTRRRALEHVRAHLVTALRLRRKPQTSPAAVFTPAGVTLHVEGETAALHGREVLAKQVSTIEHVRARKDREADGASAWRALVEGRWSVVERHESDGKRLYYAYENAATYGYSALSPRESQLVELSAQGLTGKEVAYALGLSEATVSRGLASAAARLGFAGVPALVRVAAGLLRSSAVGTEALHRLSRAERAVMALACEGYSNQGIAALHGVSVRTVANQMAAVMRKTGVHGRRGLLGLQATEEAGAQRIT